MRSSLNVEKFMQSLSLLLLTYAHQYKVEDAVKENDNQNEDITIVFCLIDSDYKTESFH